MTNKIEILAPAGNMDNLIAAVRSGANAVYLGVQSFNARASATNFDFETLTQAVKFCHGRNVKVNVTLNTILYDLELESFKETVKNIATCGVDAVIVQDLAAAEIIKNIAPTLPLHASTQMAVHNLEGAQLLKKMGYSRVILSRELSLKQIEYITKNCDIETEVFVHGALCVSLSGQCYASAFLGGRSGNRGRCAGTCRLPMSACGDCDDNHLSLKDLSALDMLPTMEEIGVTCVKIEGRLRTPEYVASAVDSAVKALNRQSYDKQLLSDTFSRSGFTNGFLEDHLTGDVFGVRTKEDAQKTKETLPKIRQLYRREGQFVPIDFTFEMGTDKSILSITDGENVFSYEINQTLQETENDFYSSLKNSLEKLGGTPFFANKINLKVLKGKYLPLSFVNEARRALIAQLLEAREVVCDYEINNFDLPARTRVEKKPKYIARFEKASQIPLEFIKNIEYIILPLKEWVNIDLSYKEKVVLELPRDMFNGTSDIKVDIDVAKQNRFDKFCIQNIGHIPLVDGQAFMSSFTLNISNSLSAKRLTDLGVKVVTLSPEISLDQIKAVDGGISTAVIGYGHIPVMLTKACPLQNIKTCKDCNGSGFLTDRKNMELPVLCHGKIKGYREIFNPIPIYMGDRINEVSCDYINLRFTIEGSGKVKSIMEKFFAHQSFNDDFTRGLYYKASM